MRIRLHGTPPENRAMLATLTETLDIHTISRPYPDRPPSTMERIYIDASPPHGEQHTTVSGGYGA